MNSTALLSPVAFFVLAVTAPTQAPSPSIPIVTPFLTPISIPVSAPAQAPQPSPLPMTYESRAAATPDVPVASGPMTVRLHEITRLHNSMPHLLVGIGIVTGLQGTGSSDRGTRQALLNMIRDQNLNFTISDVTAGNTALVSLTTSLKPFSRQGNLVNVDCQVIGDATSLRGGVRLRAELRGVDNQTHVVAQGTLSVAGVTAQGSAASVQKNLATTATLIDGGIVIRDMPSSYFSEAGDLEIEVTTPSNFTAMRIAEGIRKVLMDEEVTVSAVDQGLVRIQLPLKSRNQGTAMAILSRIRDVRVEVDNPAKVLVDQSSGTVIAGEGVLITPCVFSIGELTISIVDETEVSQPNALSNGETQGVNRTRIQVESQNSELKAVAGGATVGELLQNLRALNLTPAQLVNVFTALQKAGYLHAPLEVR